MTEYLLASKCYLLAFVGGMEIFNLASSARACVHGTVRCLCVHRLSCPAEPGGVGGSRGDPSFTASLPGTEGAVATLGRKTRVRCSIFYFLF